MLRLAAQVLKGPKYFGQYGRIRKVRTHWPEYGVRLCGNCSHTTRVARHSQPALVT